MLPPNTVVSLREDYENQKQRININVLLSVEKEKAPYTTDETIMGDRKLRIQAAIMRVMKARKQLTLEKIFAQVLKLLSSRFKPTVSVVKKCVGILKDKDYLATEEKEGEPVTYIYLE